MVDRVPRTARAKARAAHKEELAKRTTRTSAYGGEQDEQETLGTVDFPAGVEPAFLRVAVGQTYNLGNYESLRLDVSVTIPCLPDEESLRRAHRQASDFVAEKLLEEEQSWIPSTGKKSASKRG